MEKVSELVRAERQFGKRRSEIHAELVKFAQSNLATLGTSVANPKFSDSDVETLKRARRFAFKPDEALIGLCLGFSGLASLIVVGEIGSVLLAAMAFVLLTAVTLSLVRLATKRLEKYGKELALRRPELKLNAVDYRIAKRFEHGHTVSMKANPSDDVLDSLTEAAVIFEDLIVAAADFEANQLSHTKAAQENRKELYNITADVLCLAETMEEQHALSLRLESVHGYQAVERARQFRGLLNPGAGVKLETENLRVLLEELE